LLFRSSPPSTPPAKGSNVKLHPMIEKTDGIFTTFTSAVMYQYDSGKTYSPKDYPSILKNEYVTSPASTKIMIKFQEDYEWIDDETF
jgi:hypothetical protein